MIVCFCCNGKTDVATKVEGLPICPSCINETFIIYDSYLDVYVVHPEGNTKEYNAMREYAKRYLDTFSARKEINENLSGHQRFKIIPYEGISF